MYMYVTMYVYICTCTVGQCFDAHIESPTPGLELVIGTKRTPNVYDTIVMANLVSHMTNLVSHMTILLVINCRVIFS